MLCPEWEGEREGPRSELAWSFPCLGQQSESHSLFTSLPFGRLNLESLLLRVDWIEK